MRYFLIIIFLTCSALLYAQRDSVIFDNQIKLKEGIYTSFSEIIANNPKYQNCSFETKGNFLFGKKLLIYYSDRFGNKFKFDDRILLVVHDGIRYVKFKKKFNKLILTGTISTFFIEKTYHDYRTGYTGTEDKLYFVDLKTNMIKRLKPIRIREIFRRDNILYSDYQSISDSKKRKTLYFYVLKYNMRNPIYIEMN